MTPQPPRPPSTLVAPASSRLLGFPVAQALLPVLLGFVTQPFLFTLSREGPVLFGSYNSTPHPAITRHSERSPRSEESLFALRLTRISSDGILGSTHPATPQPLILRLSDQDSRRISTPASCLSINGAPCGQCELLSSRPERPGIFFRAAVWRAGPRSGGTLAITQPFFQSMEAPPSVLATRHSSLATISTP